MKIEAYYYVGLILSLTLLMLGIGGCVSYFPKTTALDTTLTTLEAQTTAGIMPAEWEYRWLARVPCSLPCWEGVTPGVTTVSDTVEILRESASILSAELENSPLRTDKGYVLWDWNDGKKGGQIEYNPQDQNPVIMCIRPSYYGAKFKFEDVIDAYGEPSHVIAYAKRGPDANSKVTFDLFVIYDFLGLKLGVVGSRDKPEIAPSTQFAVVDFCSMVPDMTNSMGSGYLSAVLPWQGMKDFEYYCRDNMNGEDCHE